MNKEQQRFHAAVAAITQLLIPENFAGVLEAAESKKMDVSKAMAEGAVHLADALLAELDRTAVAKESLTPQPDADGWIAHKPGDPMPCHRKDQPYLQFRDGEVLNLKEIKDTADNYHWGVDENCRCFEIIAWKPADNS